MVGQLEAGRALCEAGNFAAARKAAESHLRDDPHDALALDLLFDSLNGQGAHQEALDLAIEWRERAPLSSLAQGNVIVGYLNLRKKKQAREALDRFRETFPWDSDTIKMLSGKYGLVFGDFDRAGEAFTAFSEARPDNINGKLGRMIAEAGAERYASAVRLGREIIASDPNNQVALMQLARAEVCLMRFKRARAHAEAAMRIDPAATAMREVIWISRVALFPPFLFAHLALFVCVRAHEALRSKIVGLLGMLGFFWLFESPFKGLMEAVNIFAIPHLGEGAYWLALGWLLWLCLYPWVASKRAKLRSKSVKLAGY